LTNWQESARVSLGATNVVAVALSPGAGTVALGCQDGKVTLNDAGSLRPIAAFSGFAGADAVLKLRISSDGRMLVGESTRHVIKAWDLASQREMASLTLRDRIVKDSAGIRLSLSPEGRTLVAPFWDGIAEVWDLFSHRKRATLINKRMCISSAAFFRDGRRLATSSFDRTARVWDLETERVLTTLSGDQTGLRCVALSSDEQRLAAGNDVGAIKKVKLWDLASGQALAFVAAHHSPITDVEFWADGSAIVSVSKDTVCVLRAPSWEEIDKLERAEASRIRQKPNVTEQ